ncbi:phosphotransferase enzyme family protein [Psychrobacillus soli]|uniref:Serine kinase n=1 Tax=Psychrobacillus soli TaxID=1543965 RepID=A0A544SU28_9BACI|nr:phosphotransferase [Psychrobacillus soli]TQR08732.1 serine kinase [Psychrobacillus soli]
MSDKDLGLLENVIENFHTAAKLAKKNYRNLDNYSLKLLNYSENATYLLSSTEADEKFILRINRPNYHTKEEIEGEIRWIIDLHKYSSIDVPQPLPGDTGVFVYEQVIGDLTYYSTLFTFLEGVAPDENNEEKLASQFELLGEVTAKVHVEAVKKHDEFSKVKRLTWDFDTILGEAPKWGKWQNGQLMNPERIALLEKVVKVIKEKLEYYGKSKNRFGLIHADLRLANLLVEGDKIKIIDFDDCGFGWYLQDLSSALSFIEDKPYVDYLIAAYLKGYRRHRELSKEDIEIIPTLVLLRRLQLISWLGSRDNDTTRSIGPDYSVGTDALAKGYLDKYEGVRG